MLDFETLTDDISTAAQGALEEAIARHRGETIVGFALCSDAGAMGVSPAFNTSANLDEDVRGDPIDATYYRWSPGEWDLESSGVEHFESINARIRTAAAAVLPERFEQFRTQLFSACVAGLDRVKRLPRFTDALSAAVVVFTVTDFEDPPREKAWISELNRPEDAQQFCRWLDSL
jgi:hypothetical protein